VSTRGNDGTSRVRPPTISGPVGWMTFGSVASWLVVWVTFGHAIALSALIGMVGPLLVATVTWVGIERVYRQSPEKVTALMIAAFACKMIFFGAYVVGALQVPAVRTVPFVASFTSYFIGLHAAEAVWLQRLFRKAGSGNVARPGRA
jgi:hypothetical protein